MANPAINSFSETQDRTSQLFDKRLVLIVGATRWGTAWVQQCLDAHPDICAKGEGHFTDLLFPKIAAAFDDYNSESDQISNRLQLAGLPGNAAGYTFDDVDHVLRVAIGLALDRWLDGRNPSCIIEKTPEHVLNLDLLLRVLPSACVIHVVR
ncbi:MAG: sulfotransferase, partial [Rhodospirillales bacterium]|nr:sulfotransferase [Rhodospirillales bacterium]